MAGCSVCGKSRSEGARVESYDTASGPRRMCDDCLFTAIADSWGQPPANRAPLTEAMDEELRLHGAAAYEEYA